MATSPARQHDESKMREMSFPWQLHCMLEAAISEGFGHVVSWLDDGKSFRVHDSDAFVAYILPRFFPRQSRYKSFQRQLNIWNFKRLIGTRGPRNGGYCNVYFQRNKTHLFSRMERRKLNQPGKSSYFTKEPSPPKAKKTTGESNVPPFPLPLSSAREDSSRKGTLMLGGDNSFSPLFRDGEVEMLLQDDVTNIMLQQDETGLFPNPIVPTKETFQSQAMACCDQHEEGNYERSCFDETSGRSALDEWKYIQIGLQMASQGSLSFLRT